MNRAPRSMTDHTVTNALKFTLIAGIALSSAALAFGDRHIAFSVFLGALLGVANSLYLAWLGLGQRLAGQRQASELGAARRFATRLGSGLGPLKLVFSLAWIWTCLSLLHADALWLSLGLASWIIGLLVAALQTQRQRQMQLRRQEA